MTTLFICNCCGRIASAQQQASGNPARAPLTQVDCRTKGCANEWRTHYHRAGDDCSQVLEFYTALDMSAEQADRYRQANQGG